MDLIYRAGKLRRSVCDVLVSSDLYHRYGKRRREEKVMDE